MTFSGMQTELINWSKSARSPCIVYKVSDVAGISQALADARAQHLSVIPHGAGHSYTDAAMNTAGVVIDVTPMCRILSWDADRGVMCVEPGVTLRDMLQMAWQDGWWPVVSPSTPEVTIGGCVAMNVNGRNAWKCGPFGTYILSLDVLLTTGEVRKLVPERDSQFFRAFVGSLGLLGIIISISVQLERIPSGVVTIRKYSAASLDEVFTLFAREEHGSDFMEAWLDGLARADQLGRGILTCAAQSDSRYPAPSPFPTPGMFGRLEIPLVSLAANLLRPVLLPAVQTVNRANYFWGHWTQKTPGRLYPLVPYTYWPSAAFAGYPILLPQGVETFQAFVPGQVAKEIFKHVLSYSQQHGCFPIWCIVKQHRRDPFLLSYQVDGFSLELNYQRTSQIEQTLKQVLQHMIAIVIEAGGRFYLAKDHFQTHAQYRQSVGDEVIDAFLTLKQRCDPEMLLQSDLYRRVFLPSSR
jgi:decaprenylphospho-beta-D-ribofuranose 2-oxidase